MIDSRQMTCELCKKPVPISEIKYMPKGADSRIAVCAACREKTTLAQKGGAAKPVVAAPKKEEKPGKIKLGEDEYIEIKASPQVTMEEPRRTDAKAAPEGKTAYRCTRCNYSFKFDNKKPTPRCPYCGKADKLTEA